MEEIDQRQSLARGWNKQRPEREPAPVSKSRCRRVARMKRIRIPLCLSRHLDALEISRESDGQETLMNNSRNFSRDVIGASRVFG